MMVKNNSKPLLITALLVLFNTVALAAAPPPPPGAAETTETVQQVDPGEKNAQFSLGLWFRETQEKGARYLRVLIKNLKGGKDSASFWILIAFSLGYGVLHTLGPGHGKMIVTGYFLEQNRTLADAAILSLIISGIHGSGALLMAGLFHLAQTTFPPESRMQIQYGFSLFSGLLITAIGLYHGWNHLHRKDRIVTKSRDENGLWRRNWAVGVSVGIVPCPLSLTIMTMAIAANLVWIGVASVLTLTLSMTLVLFGISLAVLKSRTIAGRNNRSISRIIGTALGTTSLIVVGLIISTKAVKGLF